MPATAEVFTTVHDGAATPWRPAMKLDSISGEYTGSKLIDLGDNETFRVYFLRLDDGSSVSINNSYVIDECFAKVSVGQYVRLTYLNDVELGGARSPMKNYKIEVRA